MDRTEKTENPQKTAKSTNELDKVLESTHINQIGQYFQDNKDSLRDEEKPFARYMRELIKKKALKQQDVFLFADIPERYGYKLLSEQKRTRQRDVILRICYAANFTLEETQRALKIYDMPPLYSRIPRDALLMVALHEHESLGKIPDKPGDIHEVNELLKQHHMELLYAVGEQE